VVLADPPWIYENWSPAGGVRAAAANHYEVSAIDEILRLPVAALAADDCALLMWCTWPHILIGSHINIIKAWGFKPSTCAFNWTKTNASGGFFVGNGYYTRSNTEPCLLALKGSPLRLANDVSQVVMAPVGEHSVKPEEVRRRIERLFAGPYLELYARKLVPGWTVWGNEIARAGFAQMSEAAE
jgi:N6-adenosine-specific RNA methylase IME4